VQQAEQLGRQAGAQHARPGPGGHRLLQAPARVGPVRQVFRHERKQRRHHDQGTQAVLEPGGCDELECDRAQQGQPGVLAHVAPGQPAQVLGVLVQGGCRHGDSGGEVCRR